MAFTKRTVKDRAVQYPKRYKFVAVSGQADTYDLVPITGTVTEAGTAINKAYLQPIEDNLSDINDGTIIVPKATNAETLDNLHSGDFVKKLTITDEIADNGAYPENYIADISTNITRGNMPAGWYHVIYGRHMNTNGYGFQLWNAFGSNDLWIRSAVGLTWSAPKKVSEPTSHASGDGTYGFGSELKYGHVALINSLNNSVYQDGFALSGYMGYVLNQSKQDRFKLIRTIAMNTASPVRSIIPDNFDIYDELMFIIRGTISNSTSMSSAALSSFSLYDMASNGYKVDLHSHYFSRTNCFTNWDIKAISIFKHTGKWFESNFSPNRIKKAIYNKSLPSGNGDSLSYDSNLYFDFTPGYAGYTGTVYLDIYGRNL